MKVEIINSIAKEINQHNRNFQEQVVLKELEENGVLFDLYRCYREKLFPGTGKKEFASIYSHTVIFVLLSLALFSAKRVREKDLKKIILNVIQQLTGIDSIIRDILDSMTRINIPVQLGTFIFDSIEKLTGTKAGGLKEDDILPMLYERFLKRYEPVLHKRIRYYYTPGPVVSFMVHTIHKLIKEKLGIYEGLADLDIHILDPAFGTANFLAEVIKLAIEEKTKKYGEGIGIPFIESYLSSSIHGSEIMLPLYVMGYLSLQEIIKSFCRGGMRTAQSAEHEADAQFTLCAKRHATCAHPLASGGNLYLTDALKNLESVEIDRAGQTTVILCNPPYSVHSLNKGKWIKGLLKDYLMVKGFRIKEKNLKGLQDDYVKFIRYAQWKIDQCGSGIMGFITSNSYLENPTFRGMRYSLLQSFDEIYILDLKGVARKTCKNNDDENLFGVGSGIAIGFFIKKGSATPTHSLSDRCSSFGGIISKDWRKDKVSENISKKEMPGNIKENLDRLSCRVYYSCMKGRKTYKLKQLEHIKEKNIKALQWERVFTTDDFYLFTPGKKIDIYQQFIKLTDIFPVHSVGIVTARDKLTIKASEEEMYNTISNFSRFDEEAARKKYQLGDDTRDWQVIEAQKDIIESGVDRNKIVPILYRPFDLRYTYYTGRSRGFICMPRPEVMRHMLQENIGLITVRQVPEGIYNHCFVTDAIIESRITTSQKGIAYIFPLYKYCYPGEKGKKCNFKIIYPGTSMPRQCNINPAVFTRFHEFGIDKLPSSEQIFYYIYAILNSGIYRALYRDHLKIDFPRIPLTSDFGLFLKLSGLGERLTAVHLFKSGELEQTLSKFEVIGDNFVNNPHFKPTAGGDGRVYINETQYFSNISKGLWEYEICGYKVLNKWLRERKNQVLSPGEILHYIKICRALQLTIKYQKEIDVLYSQLEKSL
jgi:predicted helicase